MIPRVRRPARGTTGARIPHSSFPPLQPDRRTGMNIPRDRTQTSQAS